MFQSLKITVLSLMTVALAASLASAAPKHETRRPLRPRQLVPAETSLRAVPAASEVKGGKGLAEMVAKLGQSGKVKDSLCRHWGGYSYYNYYPCYTNTYWTYTYYPTYTYYYVYYPCDYQYTYCTYWYYCYY